MPGVFSDMRIGAAIAAICSFAIVATFVGIGGLLSKLNRAPALAAIPGYNLWLVGKECGLPLRHLSSFAASFVLAVMCLVLTALGAAGVLEEGWFSDVIGAPSEMALIPALANALNAFAILSYITCLALSFNVMYCLATSFGHDLGYALGLLLLPFVFFPLLGFRKTERLMRKGQNLETPDLL